MRCIRASRRSSSVGSIHGGTKQNIIPNEVKLQLTVRSYTDKVRNQIIAAIRRISIGTAQAAGVAKGRLPVVHGEERVHAAGLQRTRLGQSRH